MKRVYTDERFPGIELINNGDARMEVRCEGKTAYFYCIREGKGNTLSEAFLQRMACSYFNRIDRTLFEQLGSEAAPEPGPGMRRATPEEVDAADISDLVNLPPRKTRPGEIDDLMAKEKALTDPAKKKSLRRYIMALMRREESAAETLVRSLLDE